MIRPFHFVFGLAALGCDSGGATSASGSATATATAAATSSGAATAAPSGASKVTAAAYKPANVDADPVLGPNVKKVLTECAAKWDDKEGFDDCQPIAEIFPKDFESGTKDEYLVTLLGDPDPKTRYVAIYALWSKGGKYTRDKDLAARLLDALVNEKVSAVDGRIGSLAGRIDLAATGLEERAKSIVMSEDVSVEGRIFLMAGWSQSTAPWVYDVSKHYAKSNEPRLKKAALEIMGVGFEQHTEEVCAAWAAELGKTGKEAPNAAGLITGAVAGASVQDADEGYFSSSGASRTSTEKFCPQMDSVIDGILAAAKEGKATSEQRYAATGALGNAKLPVATKTKILEVLRAIVENKGNQTRDSALWALAEHDPGGKAFAEKFAADPDLKNTVESIRKR